MTKVIIDDTLRSKLPSPTAEFELCDEAGRTLGHFLPADLYRELQYAYAKAQVSDEELELARTEPGGRTLAEIMRQLK